MEQFIQLIRKEIYRFTSISTQTILGPVITSLLYQLIFGSQLSQLSTGIVGINYNQFLVPGLVMLQVLLNAYGNSSSSLVQGKYSGSIIFILMAPITPLAIYTAYLIAAIVRGAVVGVVVLLVIGWSGTINIMPYSFTAIFFFLIFGSAICGGLGIIVGLISDKFEQMAAFQSFIMVPMVYLAGVFFNPMHLHGIWKIIAYMNPLLYIVDGVRYGFIGHTITHIAFSSTFIFCLALVVNIIGYIMLKQGVKIKH